MPKGRKTDGNSRSPLKAKYDAHNVVLDKTYGAWADLRRELSDSRTAIEKRKALLEKFARCSDSQSAFLLLDDYFEQISLSRRDFAGSDCWPNLLKFKGKARLEATALLFLRAKRPLPAELMAYTNRKMITEDAVEDYVIYGYFELDYPHRCYVGKTLQSRAEQRDQEHHAGKSGAPKFNTFVNAAFIYGDRDFDDVLRYEILEHFTGTAQECAEREGEHIQRKNAIENGWNLKTEGTGTDLLFPSSTPSQHKNRPPIRRSRSNIQGDLSDEIIQDAIEFGLEQSILEKDKEYRFQELKTLIAKSFVAHANQSLNLTVQEPAPDEIKSVLNDWTKLENVIKGGKLRVAYKVRCNITGKLKSSWYHDPNKWWKEQLEKSGFERPLNWKSIIKTTREAFEKADLDSPLIQWLKGNVDRIDNDEFPQQDRKWVWHTYTSPKDVWRVIRSKFLAAFPNTLQEIAEKEEAARLQKERQAREGRGKEKKKEETIEKMAERMEKERIQRVAQARPDSAIIEKQVTWASPGVFGSIIFSIIVIICVLVSCIEERTDKRERTKSEIPFACQQCAFETDVYVEWDKHKENNPGHFLW